MPSPWPSFAEVLGVECPAGSTLELSLKSEQLVLHTARAGAIKAMVELFLSELKKASVGWQGASTAAACCPGCLGWSRGCQPCSFELPGVRDAGWKGRPAGEQGTGRKGSQAGWPLTRPPACRTPATSSPCEATSPTTTVSSASNVGTSSSCCRWLPWSQVSTGQAGWWADKAAPPVGRGAGRRGG